MPTNNNKRPQCEQHGSNAVNRGSLVAGIAFEAAEEMQYSGTSMAYDQRTRVSNTIREGK